VIPLDPEEEEILKRFVNSKRIKGTYFMDVGVGFKGGEYGIVDAVCIENFEPNYEPRILPSKWWRILLDRIRGRDVWLLEVKKRLNFEAIGQILTYSLYFPKVWNVSVKGRGIICEEVDEALEEVCHEYQITVFPI